MHLNLPDIPSLACCKNLLIAGMGGGFDVFCGLPLYFELRQRGHNVHLANFSFSDVRSLRGGIHLVDGLVGVTADAVDWLPYFPEGHLVRWFKEKRGEDVTLWSFEKSGARPLLARYQALVAHLQIDGIVLVDGGVDSLMRGDECQMGTVIEDATSLWVVNELTAIPLRLVVCTALGAEQDVTYAHVLENIAALTKAGDFLGACALHAQMEACQAYMDAVLQVQSQPFQDPSVINSCLVSALRGEFGDFHLTPKTQGGRLWISPLMAVYWFFELAGVARQNSFLPRLKNTLTFSDGLRELMASPLPKRRSATVIPL